MKGDGEYDHDKEQRDGGKCDHEVDETDRVIQTRNTNGKDPDGDENNETESWIEQCPISDSPFDGYEPIHTEGGQVENGSCL